MFFKVYLPLSLPGLPEGSWKVMSMLQSLSNVVTASANGRLPQRLFYGRVGGFLHNPALPPGKVAKWQGGENSAQLGPCVTTYPRCEGGSRQGGKMARWQGGKVAMWQGGKVARWQGGKVVRWQGGKVQMENACFYCYMSKVQQLDRTY
jgi:hypothetical protein